MRLLISRMFLASLASVGLFAIPTLTITDTVTSATTTITDGGAGDTDGMVDGNITYASNSFFAGWNIIVSAGTTKPILGSAILPVLNLNSTLIRKPQSGGSMLFQFLETGFTGKPYQGTLTGQGSSIKSAGNANVYSTLNNAAYNSLAPIAWNKSSSSAPNNTGPAVSPLGSYSLGLSYQVNVLAGINAADTNRQANVDASLSSVPEPGFYGLLAAGLSGVVFVVSRRRRSDSVV